jgi:hypothetical protein
MRLLLAQCGAQRLVGAMGFASTAPTDTPVPRRSLRLKPSCWESVRGALIREGLELPDAPLRRRASEIVAAVIAADGWNAG